MSHSGFGMRAFTTSWGESKARVCVLPRLDDSETCAEVCGCLFCGPIVAPDKFSHSKGRFSLNLGELGCAKGP